MRQPCKFESFCRSTDPRLSMGTAEAVCRCMTHGVEVTVVGNWSVTADGKCIIGRLESIEEKLEELLHRSF